MPEDQIGGPCVARTPMVRSCSRKWPWILTCATKWEPISGGPGLSITFFSRLTPTPRFPLPMFLHSRIGLKR